MARYLFACALMLALCACGQPAAGAKADAGGSKTAAAPSKNFDWDKWAALANEDPCKWLDPETLDRIIGAEAVSTYTFSKTAISCAWRSADGEKLLFTASIYIWDSARNVAHEREGQLKDISTGFFEQLPTPGGVVTAVMRKDRLGVSIFANSDSETVMLFLNGHPMLREDAAEREQRNTRLRAFSSALIEQYGL